MVVTILGTVLGGIILKLSTREALLYIGVPLAVVAVLFVLYRIARGVANRLRELQDWQTKAYKALTDHQKRISDLEKRANAKPGALIAAARRAQEDRSPSP